MILLAGTVLLLWRAALWDGGLPSFGNALLFYHPLTTTVCRQLMVGRLPLWNPLEFSGLPLWADPQAGVLTPTHVALRLLGFPWGLRGALAVEALLAAVGAFLLARLLGQRRGSAFIAGLVFSCGGFLFAKAGMTAYTASLALMPLTLLFWVGGQGWLLGLALTLQLFGGHPFFLYITLACGACMRPPRPWRTLARAAALGGPLACALLLPARETFAASARWGMLAGDSLLEYSVPPDALWLMLTRPWWNRFAEAVADPTVTTFYVGLPALLLALAAAGARSRAAKAWAVGGLTLMLGAATPAYPLLLRLAPGLSWFRFPAQWGAAASLGLALCAGSGSARLSVAWRALAAACIAIDLGGFLALPATARCRPEFYSLAPQALRDGRLRAGDRVAHSLRFFSGQIDLGDQAALFPSHATVFGLSELLSDNICRPQALDRMARASLRGGSFPEELLRRLSVSAWFDLEEGRAAMRMVRDPLPSLRVEPRGRTAEVSVHPGRLSARVELPEPGRLVWAQRLDGSWRVWVDGRPAAALPYQEVFAAVPLMAGVHEVGFRYAPRSVTLGIAMALAAFLAATALAAVRLRLLH